MAKKPRDTKAEYARRKARGIARGQSGSEYRGHKPPPGRTEAAVRRERELREYEALGKLPDREKQAVKRFARQRAEFAGLDPEESEAELLEWTSLRGYAAFAKERDFMRNLGQQGMTMAAIEFRCATGDGFPDPRMYWYRRRELMRGHSYTPRRPDQQAARRRRERRQRRKGARRKAA
jgi:hypothetical protein